ncbi:PstS family phosphate ABC transporter substrate-binding protein [Spirulina sp. 06S082]|uniref:PstS family phosphate ABC transporter substrate-binding protein n=1 Tax=Spirulina sp. 06S082 TaxID=3110248 RepID=UPI002B217886|nr:PstS family phosphate ABC transporter substrate-binding protein [Spirulina sp. 06S082]MEA5467527.1 PstS family phosphate ABC transporter substrate-binding protein [Spirulina sp. 06S082]
MVFLNTKRSWPVRLSAIALLLALTACGTTETTSESTESKGESESASEDSGLSGDVLVDGSSTVFPISEAMAEEFMKENSKVRVTVGVSGSGGGFKKFCAGETDISNASRPIKESEIELCKEAGIEFVEVPVAFDGISVVVNKENDWATCLKPEELSKMWEPAAEEKITNWKQIRDEFPDQTLSLYGPGTDSGTYDYFTEATYGEEGESRGDYTASEDDNVIVQGVEADKGSLGFFGFAYYEENKDALKVLEIENSAGECITPSSASIEDGTYNPLARPIFFYVKKESLDTKPAVKAFVDYQISSDQAHLVTEVGYVALPSALVSKIETRIAEVKLGSIFEGGTSLGVKLADKL